MNKRDKFLGLGNKITRRDFMQGVAGFSASLAVSKAFGEKKSPLGGLHRDQEGFCHV